MIRDILKEHQFKKQFKTVDLGKYKDLEDIK